MDEFQRSWLLAQLGPDTDPADLERRYFRLRSVRAVALEVLGERRAKLLADPLKVSVDGVVTMDLQENLRGIERQIDQAGRAPAPDDPVEEETEGAGEMVQVTWIAPVYRYR
ncbi:hypothetical protein [Streptomyces sp. V3I7]|uniref:hypothetical protein n=1 Tax=Streptomyces sp. V3I7 TaxID=3042278 RepID=UPI002787DBEA|nr:hypothetical protein [Streptomyces sp. V3I7]MDQ0990740.1 hypothetical protein [Streptomyces sp. V3I7]